MAKTKLPLWLLKNSEQKVLLRQVATPLDVADLELPEFQQLIDDMVVTMRQAHGVGLAAPQIGRSIRLAVIDGEANDQSDPIVLVNPVLSQVTSSQHELEEGCLSIPKVFGPVPRAQALTLRAFDRHGKPYTVRAEHFFARVIQHEIDHLNGKLFIDRAREITSGKIPK